MYWSDQIAQQIIDSQKYSPYWVDDMKTPSGRIHVGSLRGVVIHDLIYKSLLDKGLKAKFTYVFDDHDPMDEISANLDKGKWQEYLGQPLFTVPSPDGKDKNYADYFANEFVHVFNNIGCRPEIIKASDLYLTGKINPGIKICLDNAPTIRKIYEQLYKKKISSDWYPFQVVCPKCGKEATTKVNGWDGVKVNFVCATDAVKYTTGCGHRGEISPFSGAGKYVGKIPWKIEWAAKWQVIGVTIEGAGKDHMVDGGSHDVAKQICQKILKYPVPYPFSYEFFLLGGKKMSSSKGLGSSAKEISDLLPPYLLRFLFTRTNFRKAIEFNPVDTVTIPDLFDEYDRCWSAYNDNSDELLSRIFELSQIKSPPMKQKKLFIPRFRDVTNYIQNTSLDELPERFENLKGSRLTFEELKILRERENYAAIWTGKYAPEELRFQLTDKSASNLSSDQKIFLKEVIKLLDLHTTVDELNLALYQTAQKMKLNSKIAFSAIYLALIDKAHGPRAAWLLLKYPKKQIIDRLSQFV